MDQDRDRRRRGAAWRLRRRRLVTALTVEATQASGTVAGIGTMDGEIKPPCPDAGQRGRPAPGQPPPQQVAGSGQPAADGAQRAAQLRRGLLLRQALPVAEHHRGAVLLGQSVDLLLDERADLQPIGRRRPRACRAPNRPRAAPGARPRRRRDASTRARAATRHATPKSQLSIESRLWIDPHRRARTMKVAWKASSASFQSLSTLRQTRSTIGPCRRTRTSKAASDDRIAMVREPLEELPVGHPADGPRVEERLDVAHSANEGPPDICRLLLWASTRLPKSW